MMSRSRCGVVVIVVVTVVVTGCHLFQPKITSPLSYRAQSAEIRGIVPLGTQREDAIRRLDEAGITGDFGESRESMYHCFLWNRKDSNDRWHLNISLLFDVDGRFYATRPSDHDSSIPIGDSSRVESPVTNRTSRTGTEPFVFPEPKNPRTTEPPRRGDARRTPFLDPRDL